MADQLCGAAKDELCRAWWVQVNALEHLAQLLQEALPGEDDPYCSVRKQTARSVQDLSMRTAWALMPQPQEKFLVHDESQMWKLHEMLDDILRIKQGWGRDLDRRKGVKAQLLGASRKALMVWSGLSFAKEKTACWTGHELAQVLQNHMPQLATYLRGYNEAQNQSLVIIFEAIGLLLEAKHRPTSLANSQRIDVLLKTAVDWACRTLWLTLGQTSPKNGPHYPSQEVRNRILNRYWVLKETATKLFRKAASEEIWRREEKERLKAQSEEEGRKEEHQKEAEAADLWAGYQPTDPDQREVDRPWQSGFVPSKENP